MHFPSRTGACTTFRRSNRACRSEWQSQHSAGCGFERANGVFDVGAA